MAAKFHVNGKGEAGKCSASNGKCPFGGETGTENHYDTVEQAQAAAERQLSAQHGAVTTVTNASKGSATAYPGGVGELGRNVTSEDVIAATRKLALAEVSHKTEEEISDDDIAVISGDRDAILARYRNLSDDRRIGIRADAVRTVHDNRYAAAFEAGVPLSPEMEAQLDIQWNDAHHPAGKVETEKTLKEVEDGYEAGRAHHKGRGELAVFEATHQSRVASLRRQLATAGRSNKIFVAEARAEVGDAISNRLLTPTVEDRTQAEQHFKEYFASRQSFNDWERRMGKKYRTDKNVADYHNQVIDSLNDHDKAEYKDLVAKQANTIAKNKYAGRAYREGFTLNPSAEAELERRWNMYGDQYEDRLEKAIKMRDDLNAGRINPSKVVGTGYRNPKKMAAQYLDDEIAKRAEVIQTRGRSNENVWGIYFGNR